jgi:hypothetical protein
MPCPHATDRHSPGSFLFRGQLVVQCSATGKEGDSGRGLIPEGGAKKYQWEQHSSVELCIHFLTDPCGVEALRTRWRYITARQTKGRQRLARHL